ncbi:hypothetical protein BKP35_04980 [Anaerobacillus arseniciselenatis]|uniref:Staygreen protein domain-containing protein n=1 Tax=Anaerobacillus arseniciselenatis TaxID=85682 RepID=A0A1S2LSU1_9BACI|nr:staygreen family protein [Anaerobacillus arseniciselenatis]OIJ15203.1 hypothetical protein BKP35_04980 [Anaerobacillus arseniciselenatis]
MLAEWQKVTQCRFRLVGWVYIDAGKFSEEEAGFRFNIFQQEMTLALKGIVNGDLPFFAEYPQLLDAFTGIKKASINNLTDASFPKK